MRHEGRAAERLQPNMKSIAFLMFALAVEAANSQTCVDPSEATLTGSARGERQASARAALGKDSPLIETKHCVAPLMAIGPPEAAIWLTASTFAYEPYAISSSTLLLDVVTCAGYAADYSCEARTESHYFRGDPSFSVRLGDGVDISLASRIVDAAMNRPCGPRIPEPGERLPFLGRLEVRREENPNEYSIGTWACAVMLSASERGLDVTGMRAQVE
jgi:hypothetical protein